MKKLFAMAVLSGALAVGSAVAQEHKHEEAPGVKGSEAVKGESKKCCEGMMDKAGESKGGVAAKDEAKTKQEKMKEMKEKMAEKMKSMKMKGMKDDGKPGEASKDAQQH